MSVAPETMTLVLSLVSPAASQYQVGAYGLGDAYREPMSLGPRFAARQKPKGSLLRRYLPTQAQSRGADLQACDFHQGRPGHLQSLLSAPTSTIGEDYDS